MSALALVDGPLHGDLLAAGFAAGVLVAVVALITRRTDRAVDAAALAAATILALRADAPALIVLAVLVAAAGWRTEDSPHDHLGTLVPAAGVGLAGLAIPDGGWPQAFVDLGGLVLLFACRHLPGPSLRWVGALLIGGMLAATWAGAPDTEAPLVAGAALAPAFGAALLAARLRPGAAPKGSWTAAIVLTVWSAGFAYRGRTAGLEASLLGVAALTWWAGEAARRHRGGAALPTPVVVIGVVAWLVILAVGARTFGLHRSGTTAGQLAGLVAIGLAGFSAAFRPGEPADAGTSPT
jgi:hypothetical protein